MQIAGHGSVAVTRLTPSQLGKSDSKRVSTRSAVDSFLVTWLGLAVDLGKLGPTNSEIRMCGGFLQWAVSKAVSVRRATS
jgi:hypothetical protein